MAGNNSLNDAKTLVGDNDIKEERRLFRLHQYQILDTGTERAFDDLVHLAAEVCETSLAAISLVDRNRQWFKARLGFSVQETPREVSFCNHAISQPGLVEIKDVRKDMRFRHFPFVMETPNVCFYAAVPLFTSGGEAIGTLCVMDTRVRELDEKQKLSLETLSRQVVNLLELRYQNLALEEARIASQKALKAKAEFLSVMSHELRTPLNGMLGMVQWLMQGGLRPEQQEMVGTLKFSAENLLHLINDILDYNKLNAQKLELEKRDFNLEEILRQLSRSFAVSAQQKGLEFRMNICEDIPVVKGDPLRVTQVLTNLLGNAVKFTSSGFVQLEVSPVMETDNFVTLKFRVRDSGIGIPVEQQQHIFEEFNQAGTDISRRYGGTGLGLSITRNLLRLMESDIQVKSEPGCGAEFVFDLSFRKGQEQKVAELMMPLIPEGVFRNKRILLTEDNEVNQLITLNSLDKWGVETHIAKDGLEAVELARKHQYDLILMDLQMPLMDGFEATRQIRGLNDYYKQVPVVALTASAVLEVKQEAFESGVSDFLMKPFDPEKLYMVLSQNFSSEEKAGAVAGLKARIGVVSGDDTSFQQELTKLYIKSFREIQDDISSGSIKTAKNLRQIRHKHKPTFDLLQLEELKYAFTSLQKQLDIRKKDKQAIAGYVLEISSLTEQVIRNLEMLIPDKSGR